MCRYNFKLIIIGLFLGIVSFNSKVYAYDDGDFGIWHTEGQEFKIASDKKITLEEEFRWADNANDFYYHHYDAGFVFSLNNSLSIGGGYRHVYEKKKGKFKLENEPYLTLTHKWQWCGFKLDDRNRLEYRHFDYQADSFRYRNKLTGKLPWRFTKLEIQPYLSDEIFFKLL